MPGKRHRFTAKQDRMAKHIMRSEMKRGYSKKKAEQIGYATVVKMMKRKWRKKYAR